MFGASYANLEEVYNPITLRNQANQYKKIINDISSFNSRGKERDYSFTTRRKPKKEAFTNKVGTELDQMNLDDLEKMIDSYNKPEKKVTPTSKSTCDNFLEHIKTCKSCRAYVMENFASKTVKSDSDKNREEMLDIAIYILTGVFILFLLDTFMGLGKFLKR